MAADKIVRGKDVRLLFRDELADRKRQILIEYVGVRFFDFILTLFSGRKKSVVSCAQLGLQISPCAMKGSGGSS